MTFVSVVTADLAFETVFGIKRRSFVCIVKSIHAKVCIIKGKKQNR